MKASQALDAGSIPATRSSIFWIAGLGIEESFAPTEGRKSQFFGDSEANARPEVSVFRRERKAAIPATRSINCSSDEYRGAYYI